MKTTRITVLLLEANQTCNIIIAYLHIFAIIVMSNYRILSQDQELTEFLTNALVSVGLPQV